MSGGLKFVVFVLCLFAGCSEGFGRAVVGEYGYGAADDRCDPPLPCQTLLVSEPESVPLPAAPIDLTQCSQAGGALCSGAATMPSVGCAVAASGTLRTFQNAVDLAQVSCSALDLTHSPDPSEPAFVSIAVESWNQVHVDVQSAVPATVELLGGRLEHVSLTLRGPITLRVADSDFVRDVRVSADDPGARIELLRVQARAVSLTASAAELLVRRSRVERFAVSARRIQLESSYLADAAWQAAELNAADATLLRVRSAVERSVLSACDVEMTSFSACRSWTAVMGNFTDIQLFACSEEAGLYGAAMLRAQLEGALILDGANLIGAVLGLAEASTITTWDAQLTNITFCADQHPVMFGGVSGVRCGRCDLAEGPVRPAACQVPGAQTKASSSDSCPSLDLLPACSDPQPERMRPPRR